MKGILGGQGTGFDHTGARFRGGTRTTPEGPVRWSVRGTAGPPADACGPVRAVSSTFRGT
ncbi:hypothetical protein SAMN05428945_5507 [Streptomyces sp. 2224.1]|nr:hypothetical protein SAMN05428945_5507 [Streptomyces sp. 2224.1]